MAGLVQIAVGMTGAEGVRRALALRAAAVGDLTPVWDGRVHPTFLAWMDRRFKTGGAAFGDEPWVGYGAEPRYRGRKRGIFKFGKRGGDPALLRWTPFAQSSAWRPPERLGPSFALARHPEHVYERTRSSVTMGSRVPYAARHQRGGGTGPTGEPVPRRRIVTPNRRFLNAMTRAIQEHVRAAAQARGLPGVVGRARGVTRDQLMREFGAG